jgi:hypothetical protein
MEDAAMGISVSGVDFQAFAAPRFDKRAERQQARIDEGIASGSLTTGETAFLETLQSRLAARAGEAGEDGDLTRGEARRLERDFDRLSAAIFALKHDERAADPAGSLSAPVDILA